MRLAATALLMLLFALTALAGAGCKRPASSGSGMGHASVIGALQKQLETKAVPAEESPSFVFCHPHAEQLGKASMSAMAAQVAFDTQATNDDRTEMIVFEADAQVVLVAPHATVPAVHDTLPLPWVRDMLRPPRRNA